MTIPTFSACSLPCNILLRTASALCRIHLRLLARSLLLLLLSLYTQARTPSLRSRRSRTVHHNCCKRRARDYHGHSFACFSIQCAVAVSMVQLFGRRGSRVCCASGNCGAQARSVRIGWVDLFEEFQSNCACVRVVSVVMMLVSCSSWL